MITIDGGTGIILHNGVEIASDKMHDQWVVENDENITTQTTLTNWTRSSLSDAAPYLTGMSHNSGVFTFPKTGIYRVDFRFGYYKAADRRYVGALISLSTNSGSSFFDLGRNYTHLYYTGSSATYNNSSVYTHVDVQNVSTYRMRFEVVPQSDITLYGANDDTRTMVTFNRIANT